MNRLTHLLDLIDETAGGFIRLAYLAAGITAVAVYFGAGHLLSAVEASLNAALPWALAAAVVEVAWMVYCMHDVRERHPLVTGHAL
jgi:hypothetical protein